MFQTIYFHMRMLFISINSSLPRTRVATLMESHWNYHHYVLFWGPGYLKNLLLQIYCACCERRRCWLCYLLYWSPRAGITKHHRLGTWTTGIYFLTAIGTGSPRSRCRRIQALVRSLPCWGSSSTGTLMRSFLCAGSESELCCLSW